MASFAGGCKRRDGWKMAALFVLVASLLLDGVSFAQDDEVQCVVADFNLCPCHSRGSDSDPNAGINVDCNSMSIPETMAAIRASSEMTRRLVMLTFLGGPMDNPNSEIPTNLFVGLPRLQRLVINFQYNLRELRPGVFNSVSNLTELDIRDNGLEWLSAESFSGLGSSLEVLKLGTNPLRSLRSDLRQFFNGIAQSINMENLDDLVCDCHLSWLPTFIAEKEANSPQTSIEVRGSTCSDQGDIAITDPAVNFDLHMCNDICMLGYHNCHPNATCTVVGGTMTACACKAGYQGDGFNCTQITPCTFSVCDPNAACIVEEAAVTCVCNPGFTGDGSVCASLQICNETCLTLQTNLRCVVLPRQIIECASPEISQLYEQVADLEANPTISGAVMVTQRLLNVSGNLTYAGDVLEVGNLLFRSVNVLTNNPDLYELMTYTNLVMVASELLDIMNIPLWLDLNESTASAHIVELFGALDDLGQALFLQGPPENDVSVVSENIAVVVTRPDCESKNQSIKISSNTLDADSPTQESSLVLPVSVFGDNLDEGCSEVGVIAIVYGGTGPDLLSLAEEFIPKSNCTPTPPNKAHGRCEWYPEEPCPDLEVNSVVITAVAVRSTANRTGVNELNTSALAEPIVITLQHKNATHVGPNCAFLNEQEVQMGAGRWLTEGCTVNMNQSDSDTTVCECNHLTSFAILTSPAGTPPPNFALDVVSKIGLSISIICLIITIILLFTLKIKETKLHHIHRQLALALCLAQTLFLVGVDRILVPSPDALCTTIAVLLHYLFLCTFAWQLVEGVHLYLFIVRVFFNKKIVYAYYPLAWGTPLIIVVVTLGVRFCDYGSQYTCWITVGNGTNWAFHGPVIAVILVNVVVMVMVMYVILRAKKKRNDDTFLLCTLLHSSFVLLPVLGITWALGFFVIGDNVASEIVEWLFCLMNSIQGLVIFIVHCLMNREVRRAFLKACGCHEAAKKQESVRTQIRRSSTVNSFNQFNMALKRTFSFTGRRRSSASDVTSLPISEGPMKSHGRSVLGIVAEQGTTMGMANPGYLMEEIAEEGSSIGSSVPGTPLLGDVVHSRVAETTVEAAADEEQGQSSSDRSSLEEEGKIAVENPAHRLI